MAIAEKPARRASRTETDAQHIPPGGVYGVGVKRDSFDRDEEEEEEDVSGLLLQKYLTKELCDTSYWRC